MNRRRVIRIIFFTVVALMGIAATFRFEVVSAATYLRNPNAHCPWDSSYNSITVFVRQVEDEKRIFTSSQVVARDGGLERLATPEGEFWVPAGSREEIAFDLAEQGRKIYDWKGVGVKSGDVVLDCGANIGLFVRSALRAGASKVIAIEPVPANATCIRRNFPAELASGKVVVVEKGVWDKDDFLEMNISPDNAAAHSFIDLRAKPGSTKMRLPLTTIDQIVEELGLARVDFIKTDIEGAERNALAGARKTVVRFKPRMALSVYHLPDDPVAIPAKVREARPDYRQSCGPCMFTGKQFLPQVFFYQ